MIRFRKLGSTKPSLENIGFEFHVRSRHEELLSHFNTLALVTP